MSARTELSTALKSALPGFRVIGLNTQLDAVTKPTVMVWQSLIRRPDDFGLNRLLVTLDAWVLVGQENSGTADNALDKALEKFLGALQPITWVEWTQAERGIFADAFHGYKVTLNAVAQIDTDDTEGA